MTKENTDACKMSNFSMIRYVVQDDGVNLPELAQYIGHGTLKKSTIQGGVRFLTRHLNTYLRPKVFVYGIVL